MPSRCIIDRFPALTWHGALLVTQVWHFTCDLHTHDLAAAQDGRLVFVNMLFNCLVAVSATHSFVPQWSPESIGRMAAEDRFRLKCSLDQLGQLMALRQP